MYFGPLQKAIALASIATTFLTPIALAVFVVSHL